MKLNQAHKLARLAGWLQDLPFLTLSRVFKIIVLTIEKKPPFLGAASFHFMPD
jgi:hypothetical protein